MVTLKAPAKLNLTLEVLGKRDDGYHEIRSVAQTIGLRDRWGRVTLYGLQRIAQSDLQREFFLDVFLGFCGLRGLHGLWPSLEQFQRAAEVRDRFIIGRQCACPVSSL